MSDEPRRGGGIVTLAFFVFVVGLFWGYHLLTAAPGSGDEESYTCQSETVKTGQNLAASQVAVDVYNGSDKEGLAGRVSTELQERGFRQGTIANSLSAIKPMTITILSNTQSDPRVQLVAQQFKTVDFRTPDFATGSAVTVLVGDGFTGLAPNAPTSIKASSDVSLCY